MFRAKAFVLGHLKEDVEQAASGREGGNWKSQFQQLMQRDHGATPVGRSHGPGRVGGNKFDIDRLPVAQRRIAEARTVA